MSSKDNETGKNESSDEAKDEGSKEEIEGSPTQTDAPPPESDAPEEAENEVQDDEEAPEDNAEAPENDVPEEAENEVQDDEEAPEDDAEASENEESGTSEDSNQDEAAAEEGEAEEKSYKKFFTPNRSAGTGMFFMSLVTITWALAGALIALALPLSLTTILLMYILSGIVFICCPCLGLMGAAGTTAIWTIGLSFCALIVTLATIIGGAFSLLAAVTSFRSKSTLSMAIMSLIGHIVLYAILYFAGIASFGLEMFEVMLS